MKAVLRLLISLPVIALVIGGVGCNSSATLPASPTSPAALTRGATIQGTGADPHHRLEL